MPWVRFDDMMPENRKIRDLTNAAFRLHISAICWCNRHLTDGRIGHTDLKHVSDIRSPATHAAALVNVGLWKPTETGWVIHDYLEYQFSAERIRADRKAAAERQAKWKAKKREGNAVTDDSGNAVSNAYPGPGPTPYPPQPQKNSPDGSVEPSDWNTWADHLPPSVAVLRPKPQREGSWDDPDHGWTGQDGGNW